MGIYRKESLIGVRNQGIGHMIMRDSNIFMFRERQNFKAW